MTEDATNPIPRHPKKEMDFALLIEAAHHAADERAASRDRQLNTLDPSKPAFSDSESTDE